MADRNTVERLAKAWLAEAKRLRSFSVCACGECDQVIKTKTRFISGHDAKLLARYRREIAGLIDAGGEN
jgi:hypothetical protein